MPRITTTTRTTVLLALLAFLPLVTASCSIFRNTGSAHELPPILAQDEIIRPYVTLGKIQITVDRYGPEYANLHEWGRQALREEAAKMGADAVMLPEISSRPTTYLIVPSTEYNARGVAIRFK